MMLVKSFGLIYIVMCLYVINVYVCYLFLIRIVLNEDTKIY